MACDPALMWMKTAVKAVLGMKVILLPETMM